MLNARVANDFGQGRRKVFQNHNGRGARVFQLMLKLTRCVQGVHIHAGVARAQNRRHGDRKLRHIGQHDGNAVAGF